MIARASNGVPVRDLARDRASVTCALSALGIRAGIGDEFPCVLPGGGGHRASVQLDPRSGLYKYRAPHLREWEGTCGWLVLAEVRAALGYGRLRRMSRIEELVWYRRVFYDAGVIQVRPIDLPALRPWASRDAVIVRDGFASLAALRYLDTGPQPVAFTKRFAAAWCGLSENRAYVAICLLRRRGVIRKVGEAADERGHRPFLYMAGGQ